MSVNDFIKNDLLYSRWNAVKQSISQACLLAKRQANDVRLVVVSKKHVASAVEYLALQGQYDFAESYVQEAVTKIEALKHMPIIWHYIGRVQSNKIKVIAKHFSWVQSMASIDHMKRLNDARSKFSYPINVCIQVNISSETQKSGITIDQLHTIIESFQQYPYLVLRGIMAIGSCSEVEDVCRNEFGVLSELFQKNNFFRTWDTLSMGMSRNYLLAIECGSTMVRLGELILGPRKREDK